MSSGIYLKRILANKGLTKLNHNTILFDRIVNINIAYCKYVTVCLFSGKTMHTCNAIM